ITMISKSAIPLNAIISKRSNPSWNSNMFLVVRYLFSKETFEKCSILFKAKEGENFNHRNTFSILRIKI
ncbi:MAG TPA: hypothetical protein VMW95_01300, partial [Desulfobacterales bacterium]|nr:hypothetical protein [Desulfobacterales bacterium]